MVNPPQNRLLQAIWPESSWGGLKEKETAVSVVQRFVRHRCFFLYKGLFEGLFEWLSEADSYSHTCKLQLSGQIASNKQFEGGSPFSCMQSILGENNFGSS